MKFASALALLVGALAAVLPPILGHAPAGALVSAVVLIEIEVAMLRFQIPNQVEAQRDLGAARLAGSPRELLMAIYRYRVTTLRSVVAPLWLVVGVASLLFPVVSMCNPVTLASAMAAFVLYGAELAFLLIAMTEYRARERIGRASGVSRAASV